MQAEVDMQGPFPECPPPDTHDRQQDVAQVLDEPTIEALICEHGRALMKYLLFLTRRRDLAQDLFQETWIRVLAKRHQFSGRSQFRTWLFAIARNATTDALRKPGHLSLDELLAENDSPKQVFLGTSSDPVFAAPERLALLKALRRLAPHYRRALLLRFYGDLTLEEIARQTRIPLNTVKGHLYRGLGLMKNELSPLPCPHALRPIRQASRA